MNILFLDQFSEMGGAQLCLQDLMPEIGRRGWRSRLMTPGHGLPLRPCSNGRKTAWDFVRYAIDVPRMAATIQRTVRDEQIDLVYVNGPRVLPAVVGVPCPVIFHAHSRVDVPYARKLIDWALRRANATVIAVSAFVARDYQDPNVIYNGIRDLRFKIRAFGRKPVRIGMIGRIAPGKGHIDFIRAARQVCDAEFFVYGESMFADAAYERSVRDMARDLPVGFGGWIGDIGSALHDLDILAVPSGPNEAATRVIPEAFSAGTVVVAYPSGGIPEMIDHGRTGLLTEGSNADSLASAMTRLIDDPALCARLAAKGREEWQRRFTLEKFQTAICDLIAGHATRHKRLAPLAPAFADGVATAEPKPTHPE